MGQPLPIRSTLKLTPSAPFNFDATLHKPDHFPSADNHWQPGSRWQSMLWQGKTLGLKFESCGTVDQPEIGLNIYSHQALEPSYIEGLVGEITYRYNLRFNLAAFYHQFERHLLLGPVIERWRGLRTCCYSSLYEYLLIAIVLQNATVRRSVNMMQVLLERYGTPLEFDGQTLYAFWEPQVMAQNSEAELRALKVGYRAKSIVRVTQAFANGEMDELELRTRPRLEQRQALLNLYGIGPASVGYILGDVFQHTDEMEHISPWEQKIYSKLFFDLDPETPAPVERLLGYFNDNFAGYRALAVHYIWEDLFWQRKHNPLPWLEALIRL